MKKNTMMRLASALLVAVLLTTCAIAGTFAKYTTSDTASDSAQVAKFGVVVTIDDDLGQFDPTYATTDTTTYTGENSVVAAAETTYQLVAPGTSSTPANIKITGQPEVAVKVVTEATLELTGWEIGENEEYCPIVFTVGGTDYAIDANDEDMDTIAELIAAVEEALEVEKVYDPNTKLDSTDDRTFSWAWAFEGDNAKDTALGDAAAAGNAATISIALTTTVTQID